MKATYQTTDIIETKMIRSASKHKKTIFLILATLIGFIFFPNTIFAQGQKYSGWMDFPDSENLGGTTACAAGENLTDFIVKDYNSETTIVAPWIGVYYYRNNVFRTAVGGVSLATTTPVCFNPLTDTARVFINGDTQYYDFGLGVMVATSSPVMTGRRLSAHVHLKPRSNLIPDMENISPVSGDSLSWISIDPKYSVNVRQFPSVHSVTNVVSVDGRTFDSSWNLVQNWTIAGGGGAKIYTSTSQALGNGVYSWHAAVRLNLLSSGRPISTLPVLFLNGEIYYVTEDFGVDKTAPTATLSHEPASPAEDVGVIVSTNVADALSGLSTTEIYVDNILEKTCAYAGEPSATCTTAPKIYPVGTYTYRVIARDRATNQTVNGTGTFTVTTQSDLTVGPATPTTAMIDIPVNFSATIMNIGTGSTGGSFSNFFQVANATNGEGTITHLTATTMDALAGGANNTATSPSYTFSTVGTYSVRACADKSGPDADGVIFELNETNNCGAWVDIILPPPPVVTLLLNGVDSDITLSTHTSSFTMQATGTNNPTSCYIATQIAGGLWGLYSSYPCSAYTTPTTVTPSTFGFTTGTNGIRVYVSNTSGDSSPSTKYVTVPAPINGSCSIPQIHNTCSAGTNDIASNAEDAASYTWNCNSLDGGTNASCVEAKPINGVCGSAKGTTVTTAPTTNLCDYTSATPTTVYGSGPWTWDCIGTGSTATDASCTANKPAFTCSNNTCESAAGETLLNCPLDCKVIKLQQF